MQKHRNGRSELGYFLLLSVQAQSEVIQCISDFSDFRQPCISKTTGCTAKCTKIWASELSTYFIQGIFDSQAVKVIIMRLFGAFPIWGHFDKLVSRKIAGCRAKRTKIWFYGINI